MNPDDPDVRAFLDYYAPLYPVRRGGTNIADNIAAYRPPQRQAGGQSGQSSYNSGGKGLGKLVKKGLLGGGSKAAMPKDSAGNTLGLFDTGSTMPMGSDGNPVGLFSTEAAPGAATGATSTTAPAAATPATGASAAGGGAAGAIGGVAGIAGSAYGLWNLGNDNSRLSKMADGNIGKNIPYVRAMRGMGKTIRKPMSVVTAVPTGYYKLAKMVGRLGKKIF